jgi:hypothetical protein
MIGGLGNDEKFGVNGGKDGYYLKSRLLITRATRTPIKLNKNSKI